MASPSRVAPASVRASSPNSLPPKPVTSLNSSLAPEREREHDDDSEHAPAQRLAQGVAGDDEDAAHGPSGSTTAI
jgi:hypothetical protein